MSQLQQAVDFIRSKTDFKPCVGFVLGSGLGHFADQAKNAVSISYADIPGFESPKVVGHGGELILGTLHGQAVAILKGRAHYYEGHDIQKVVFPIRVLHALGIETLFITNAAGGLDPKLNAPGFMLITDHINLTGTNPLLGPNDDKLGPRFPDMSTAYDPELSSRLESILHEQSVNHTKGAYCGVTGPNYETPAEVRYLQTIGGGAVGMSTVNEVILSNYLGIKNVGLSCITNMAAGIQKTALTHEEVTENAALIQNTFVKVLNEFLKAL